MKLVFRIVSSCALALMFVAALLAFGGGVPPHTYRILAMVGTIGWFGSVPFWMHRRLHHPPD